MDSAIIGPPNFETFARSNWPLPASTLFVEDSCALLERLCTQIKIGYDRVLVEQVLEDFDPVFDLTNFIAFFEELYKATVASQGCLCLRLTASISLQECIQAVGEMTWEERGLSWLHFRPVESEGSIICSCRLTRMNDTADLEENFLNPVREVGECEVEVLLSLPCPVPTLHRSSEKLVFQKQEIGSLQLLDEFKRTGILICPDAIEKPGVDALLLETRKQIKTADEAMTAKDINIGIDHVVFKEISSRNKHRFDLLFDLSSQDASEINRVALSGPWVPFVCEALDVTEISCLTTAVSVVYSRPGACEQGWHADGPHVGKSADWINPVADPPYGVCVFLALIDLSQEVGFTQFWLGSHHHVGLAGFGSAALLLDGNLDAIVPQGGCVIYDYRLIHRGMPNNSQNIERPILQFFYHHKTYVESKNYGTESLWMKKNS